MTNLIGKIFGGGGDQTQLVKGFAETLSSSGGGVSGLLNKFDAVGLGDKARSWVGDSSEKQPVSGDEVRQALGNEQIQEIADKAHVPADKAADGLAKVLPDTVSKLTPGGQIPDASQTQEMLKKIPGL